MTNLYQGKIKQGINSFVSFNSLIMEKFTWIHLAFIGDEFYINGKLTDVKIPFSSIDICGGESLSTWVEFNDINEVHKIQSIRVFTRKIEPYERVSLSTEPVLLFADLSCTASYKTKKPKRKKLLKQIKEMQTVIDLLCDCKSMCWERPMTNKELDLLQKYKRES